MKKNIYILCLFLSLLAVTVFVLFTLYKEGYRVNLSGSLPGAVYRITRLEPGEPLFYGDRVILDLSKLDNPVIELGISRGYVSRKQAMLKEVGAVPFDVVALGGNRLYVNGGSTPMIVASGDSRGNILSPYPTPLILSPDCYWLVSAPYLGFDSRYFGPVKREVFTHRAKIVF
jgi:conjugative transfer signal peptidase TraF